MGNDSSKGSSSGPSSGSRPHSRRASRVVISSTGDPISITTDTSLGGPDDELNKSRSDSVHLDGHTPYYPHVDDSHSSHHHHFSLTPASSTTPHNHLQRPTPSSSPSHPRGFPSDSEAVGGGQNYSALDTSDTNASSNNGPVSISTRRDNDIIAVHTRVNSDDLELAMLHPEVEALLNLAQFYPADAPTASRVPIPPNAKQITPTVLKPRALMDAGSTLAHRWRGVGVGARNTQVMIGREQDRLQKLAEAAMPVIQARNLEIRQLNAQLAELPEIHINIQKLQSSLTACIQSMEQLNSMLPSDRRLTPLSDILEFEAGKDEDVEVIPSPND